MSERLSWSSGFARRADESEAPEQWEGLLGVWAPFLGPQGGVLYDLSGYGGAGVLQNMVLATDWTSLNGVPALNFDASNNRVLVTSPILNNVVPFTWCARIYPRTGGEGSFGVIMAKGNITVGNKRFLINESAGTNAALEVTVDRATTDASAITANDSVVYNTEQAVSLTCDADGNLKVYVNGVEPGYVSGPTAGSGAFTSDAGANLWLGDWNTSGATGAFDGLIKEWRIYNYVLPTELLKVIADADAWMNLYRLRQRRVWAVEAGGASTPQSFSGSLTPAGVVARQAAKIFAGSI